MEVKFVRTIEIIKPGLFTTVQDLGRWGFQRFGMSVAGAMDHFALRVANLLVDANEDEAVLEITMMGPEIKFNCDEVIAVTGADMQPLLNGKPVPMWTSVHVKMDDILSFKGLKAGLRSYIGFSRGIDVPIIMNSKSTFTRGKIGGFEGRKLEAGDTIELGNRLLPDSGSYLPQKYSMEYKTENTIRVVLGPQNDYFTDEAIKVFSTSEYTITSEADRMGYRLEGPKIEHNESADIISDGIVFGSVQVPGHGSPILMMADRQTTGGYTKIATVITPDLSVLGQMVPGNKLKFEIIDIDEAQKIYIDSENKLKEIAEFIKDNRYELRAVQDMKFRMGENEFTVNVREII